MPKPLSKAQRVLVRLLQEICAEEGIALEVMSQGWVFQLKHVGMVRFVYGNNFDLDRAGAQKVASDKVATSLVLTKERVPCVPHTLFLNPMLQKYVGSVGVWAEMLAYAEAHRYRVVAKPVEGAGGIDVYVCLTQKTLERAVHTLFAQFPSLALSPYEDAQAEYRLMMLDGVCKLCYAKHRPTIIGDGSRTLMQHISTWSAKRMIDSDQLTAVLTTSQARLHDIIPAGEEVLLSPKHNLGQGAMPQVITDHKRKQSLITLAQQAMQALNLRFASVDILTTSAGDKVLEVNTGVMMDNYITMVPQGYAEAKAIYRDVIHTLFS